MTYIGESAFQTCGGLESVTIPGTGGTVVGARAFSNCFKFDDEGLKTVTVSAGVASLGEGAFQGCEVLSSVIFAGSAPNIGADAFKGTDVTATYPCNDNSWTAEKCKDYGGTITWAPNHSFKNHICEICGCFDGRIDASVIWADGSNRDGVRGRRKAAAEAGRGELRRAC